MDRRDEQGSYKRTLNRGASPHRRKAPTSHPFTSAFAVPGPGSGGAGMPAKGKGDPETKPARAAGREHGPHYDRQGPEGQIAEADSASAPVAAGFLFRAAAYGQMREGASPAANAVSLLLRTQVRLLHRLLFAAKRQSGGDHCPQGSRLEADPGSRSKAD